jgi:hypothetical protein
VHQAVAAPATYALRERTPDLLALLFEHSVQLRRSQELLAARPLVQGAEQFDHALLHGLELGPVAPPPLCEIPKAFATLRYGSPPPTRRLTPIPPSISGRRPIPVTSVILDVDEPSVRSEEARRRNDALLSSPELRDVLAEARPEEA